MSAWSLLERVFGWGGVVAYHGVGDNPPSPVMHVSPARLRAQLAFLRDQYDVVPLGELVRRWRAGASTRGCVAITFDDAYLGVLQHALPVLRELDLPATVFVASDHALAGGTYWWDDVESARLGGGPAWETAVRTVKLESASGIEEIRGRVLGDFAGRWPSGVTAGNGTIWRSMRVDELTTLSRDARVDFGVHTVSHPALPMLSHDEQIAEMRDSLDWLRDRFPRVLPVVAYPYGLYDRATVAAAEQAGMIAGVTMEGRASANRPAPMIVPRVGAGELHPPTSLALRLNRALRPVLVLRNRGAHPRIPERRSAPMGERVTQSFTAARATRRP